MPWAGIGSCGACWGVVLWLLWLFEVSWRTTRSRISCSCERRSLGIVLRLIGISEADCDKVWLSKLLAHSGVAGCA